MLRQWSVTLWIVLGSLTVFCAVFLCHILRPQKGQVMRPAPIPGSSVCLVPLVGCLNVSEEILGKDRTWSPCNDLQKAFLEEVALLRERVAKMPEVKSVASYDVNVINKFLRDAGFSIQLSNPLKPPDFGVASILDVLIEWKETGKAIKLGDYDAAHVRSVSFLKADDRTVAVLETKSGDKVHMMMCEQVSGYELLALVASAASAAKPLSGKYEGVKFPMITYDEQPDVSWLVGLHTTGKDGKPAIISEAKQQTKYRMNHIGARLQSAGAAGVARSAMGPPVFVIDKPFALWITRDGFPEPYFVAYFDQKWWKNPETLK